MNDEVNENTENNYPGCQNVNTPQIHPSRKLSVLDQEKFLVEPISPIVALDTADGDSRRSQRLVSAVNSTFDSSIVSSQNKSESSSPRLQSIVKCPGDRGPRAARSISFASEARVHFFARAQGFVSVPKMGGSTLGMAYYSSHEGSLPLPPDPELGEERKKAVKNGEDNKENQRKSKRLSLSVSASSLPSIKDEVPQEESWTSSIQKPGVIKLKKVTSLSSIHEGDNIKHDHLEPVKDEAQSRSRKGRKMTRNASKGGLLPPPSMNDSEVSDSSFQLNTNKSSSRKGELGMNALALRIYLLTDG